MKILITIPTYRRIKKLKRCITSILLNTYKNYDVLVVADNKDYETQKFIRSLNKININCIVNENHKFVIGAWNFAFKQFHNDYDGFMWIVDDVELLSNCIEEAVNCMVTNFPDLDGIVGLSQECPKRPNYTYKPYGQILIGKKFVERYKEVNYQVCCPFFSHFFQDEELWMFATKLNKFIHCKEAILKHFHPCFLREELDNTHFIVRKNEIIGRDKETFFKRRSLKLLWGESWKTING